MRKIDEIRKMSLSKIMENLKIHRSSAIRFKQGLDIRLPITHIMKMKYDNGEETIEKIRSMSISQIIDKLNIGRHQAINFKQGGEISVYLNQY